MREANVEEFSGIKVEIKDFIGVVTFDRPPVNATSRPMVASIQQAKFLYPVSL